MPLKKNYIIIFSQFYLEWGFFMHVHITVIHVFCGRVLQLIYIFPFWSTLWLLSFLYYRLPRICYCGLLYYIILFRTVLFSFIAMLVFHQCYFSFYFLCFGFPCDYLFFAVVGLRRRNRFQFKVVLTPEQLSMNCNCHLATNRRFICCGFLFYCCVFICKGIVNENPILIDIASCLFIKI